MDPFISMILLLILLYILSFAIAIGIGANDETLATIAGTGKLSINKVLIIGVVCAIFGAVIFGATTTETVGVGLLSKELQSSPFIAPLLLAIIAATIFWLLASSLKSLPVSTTHSVVGAVIGVGLLAFFLPFITTGLVPIQPSGITKVIIGWVTSPIVGFAAAYLIHRLLAWAVLRNLTGLEKIEKAEKVFVWLLLAIIIFTALTRGGNDVANSVGIMYGFPGVPLPPLHILLLFSGIGMATGLFVIGRRVIKNVGSNIVQMKPSEAFSIELSVMISMTVFTLLGMPISGTQVLIFAIIGSSKARKVKSNSKEIKKIIISWIITIPVAAIVAIGFFFLFLPLCMFLGW